MDLYSVSLATGAVGLGIMAFGGLSHGWHTGHASGAHIGHSPSTHAAGAAGAARIPGMGPRGARSSGTAGGWRWTSLLSPRLLFSFFVGFGAGGILATPLGEPLRLVSAIGAGVAFEALLVGPLWRLLFRFESREASTLESAIEDEARAVTNFDANGNGLVALELDGQLVQLLATLAADERARGIRIRTGDTVRIAEVDAARGRCTVTQPTR